MGNELLKLEEYSKPELFNITNQGIQELDKKYKGMKATNNKELVVLKAAIKDIRDRRVAVKNLKDEKKKPLIAANKAIDAEAKRIIAELQKIENPLKTEKELYEAEQERIKKEKAEKEQQRIDKIQNKIKSLYAYAENLYGKSSSEIEKSNAFFNDCMANDNFDYEEFAPSKEKAVHEVNHKFKDAHYKAVIEEEKQAALEAERIANEKERKRLEEEKAELERQKAELQKTQLVTEVKAPVEADEADCQDIEIAPVTTNFPMPKVKSPASDNVFEIKPTPKAATALGQTIDKIALERNATKIPIAISAYEYLKVRDVKLTLLENAGVDNWEGYDLALENLENEIKETLEAIQKVLSSQS